MHRTQMQHLQSTDKDAAFDKPAHNITCPNLGTESCSCNKLKRLNKVVEAAKIVLDSFLEEQHQMKVQFNKDHRSILDRMPLEIINSVFEFFVNDVKLDEEGMEKSANPLHLGAVCQSWRRIAWSTPRLWTSFTMGLSPDTSATEVEIAAEMLDRSLHHPLDITLYECEGDYFVDAMDSHEDINKLIDIINRHSTRWSSLDLQLPPYLLVRISNAGGSSDLRSLNVHMNDWHEQPAGMVLPIRNVGPSSVKLPGTLLAIC